MNEEQTILCVLGILEAYSVMALLAAVCTPRLKREFDQVVFMCNVAGVYWSQQLQDVRRNHGIG